MAPDVDPRPSLTPSLPAESGAGQARGHAGSERAARPAEICRRLLATLDASEGRRRRRKRDTTPDSIGMAIKRRLLEATVRADPEPGAYEGWLLERCHEVGQVAGEGGDAVQLETAGSLRAMALDILAECRLAQVSGEFRSWLTEGAPSDDAEKASGG